MSTKVNGYISREKQLCHSDLHAPPFSMVNYYMKEIAPVWANPFLEMYNPFQKGFRRKQSSCPHL